ncbi:alpha/beta hydrolase [Sphingobium sp. TKS]|uniref:alpha/beta hydrolase n=1 Tax=Sphingobium sp. TKS TaxID=1315974 RepID=UPI0013141060|nr:alpha/beta fold hydrolase [Sphingobium sp. TKS]
MTKMVRERVTFRSGGDACVGDLFHPAETAPDGRRPAIILGNGYGGLRGPVLPVAELFARAGYRALAIDYRYFGDSGGLPRGQLFPLDQVEDFRNAISCLQQREDVDPNAIALWGTSFAGGVVLYTAAVDQRVKAVIAQVPVVDGFRWLRGMRDPAQWRDLLEAVAADRALRHAGGISRSVAKFASCRSGFLCGLAADDQLASFMEAGARARRAAGEETADRISLESIEKILEFSAERFIDRIAPRALLIAANLGPDSVHPYGDIMRAYGAALEPKTLLPLPMSQLDVYTSPGLETATAAQIDWLSKTLPAGTTA